MLEICGLEALECIKINDAKLVVGALNFFILSNITLALLQNAFYKIHLQQYRKSSRIKFQRRRSAKYKIKWRNFLKTHETT